MSAPTLSFSEVSLVLSNYDMLAYFLGVVVLFFIGLLIRDHEEDIKNGIQHPDGVYVYAWKWLALYAIAGAIFTMAVLEVSKVDLWFSLFLAWVMGAIFRTVLPMLLDLAAEKTKAILQVMFSK